MKSFKKEKGITLIALIITIVVLLILAGVAIGTLQENNIIGKAKDAASQYETGKENENEAILDMESLLDRYGKTSDNNDGPVGPMATDPKVYLMIAGSEQVVLLWAEGKLYTMGDRLKPSERWDIVQITKEEAIEQKGLNAKGFDESELNGMYFFIEDEAVFAFSNDRNTLYFPFMDEETNTMAISKDFLCGNHSDNLLAQYYHNDSDIRYYYVEHGEYTHNGTTYSPNSYMYMFNVKENKGKLYGRMNDTEYAGLDMTIIEKGYNENEFKIKVDGVETTITTNAEKLTCTNPLYPEKTITYYIQDNILYSDIKNGDELITEHGKLMNLIKIFNSNKLIDDYSN